MKWGVLAGVIVVAVLAALLLLRSRERAAGVAAPLPESPSPSPADPEPPSPSTLATSAADAATSAADAATRPLDRARRDEMRRLIYQAFGEPPPDPAGSQRVPAPSESRPLNADYINQRIREDFVPMGRECYRAGLQKHPDLEGQFMMIVHVVGDEKVGGVVESTEIEDGGTLADPEVLDCLQNSMASLTMPPPEQGGSMTFEVPMRYLLHPPDGAAP